MPQVNIHQAKTIFSKLVVSAENGEEIIIARHGKPVAKLVPISKDISPRRPGSAKGKFKVPSDFFKPLPQDILKAFEQ